MARVRRMLQLGRSAGWLTHSVSLLTLDRTGGPAGMSLSVDQLLRATDLPAGDLSHGSILHLTADAL
jgi:hypothetical protein